MGGAHCTYRLALALHKDRSVIGQDLRHYLGVPEDGIGGLSRLNRDLHEFRLCGGWMKRLNGDPRPFPDGCYPGAVYHGLASFDDDLWLLGSVGSGLLSGDGDLGIQTACVLARSDWRRCCVYIRIRLGDGGGLPDDGSPCLIRPLCLSGLHLLKALSIGIVEPSAGLDMDCAGRGRAPLCSRIQRREFRNQFKPSCGFRLEGIIKSNSQCRWFWDKSCSRFWSTRRCGGSVRCSETSGVDNGGNDCS